ncbi:hypothetical protein XCR_3561 [Xanthomonas campestris pv. raphani 756C]|nr:hypothetical protein XCR_3561 [Xanthomonas campestris pv. raphani 756C]
MVGGQGPCSSPAAITLCALSIPHTYCRKQPKLNQSSRKTTQQRWQRPGRAHPT